MKKEYKDKMKTFNIFDQIHKRIKLFLKLSTFDKLFYLFGFSALLLFLYFRLFSSIVRGFNPDEFSHFHFPYLLTRGFVPYRDFFMLYSPLFHLTLYPIFKVIGESYLAITASRFFVFLLFIATLFLSFKIARLFLKSKLAFLSVLVSASYPLPFEKAIEVRPDNLMIPVYLAGIYFSLKGLMEDKKKDRFWAGVYFALSVLVMVKIVIAVGSFFVGMIAIMLLQKKKKKYLFEVIFDYAKGAAIVILLFFTPFVFLGILKQAFLSMFRYSAAIASTLRYGSELHPFYWFYPHDFVYGIYKGISWYLSSIIVLLAVVGLVLTLIKVSVTKRSFEKILLAVLLLSSFVSVFFVLRPYQQYLLPFCSLVPIFTIFAVEDILAVFQKKSPFIFALVMFIIIGILALSMYEKWSVNKYRTDEAARRFIKYVLANTKSNDVFWGGVSEYVFRTDGFDVPHLGYFEFPKSILATLPSLIPTLEKRNTKYLYLSTRAVREKTWPFDSFETKHFASWVEENFQETSYPNLWIRKTK